MTPEEIRKEADSNYQIQEIAEALKKNITLERFELISNGDWFHFIRQNNRSFKYFVGERNDPNAKIREITIPPLTPDIQETLSASFSASLFGAIGCAKPDPAQAPTETDVIEVPSYPLR